MGLGVKREQVEILFDDGRREPDDTGDDVDIVELG